MHAMADFVDTWERFGNALNPTTPFPRQKPRLILAACLVPVILGSYFSTAYMVVKGMGFAAGFGFFGDPIITPTMDYVNTNFPHWQRYLQLRHSILRGIPTNAQLVVTLLRIGEHNKAPLPPPPISDIPPPVEPHATAGQDLEHLGMSTHTNDARFGYLHLHELIIVEGATDEEIEEAVKAGPEPQVDESEPGAKKPPKKAKRILNLLKNTTKGGVHTALAADKAKATAGAMHARNRLGAVKGHQMSPTRGPVRFPSRYKGTKGYAYITMTATTPAVSWAPGSLDSSNAAKWSVTIGDIAELKKVGGLGWKSKIVVGWAMGSEIIDGMVIKTKQGDDLHLTAITNRNELFNRLIAMGTQMWEAW